MGWDDKVDLLLVKVVREEEPWTASYGDIGNVWRRIAELYHERLSGARLSTSKRPDGRACQLRYEKLYDHRKSLDKQPEQRSGSSEEFEEIDQLLFTCVEETEAHKSRTEEEKKRESDKHAERARTQERLREHTRTTLSKRLPSASSRSPSESSPSSSSAESKSDSEVAGRGEGHPKKMKLALQIQQSMLENQKEGVKLLSAQMERLVCEAARQGDEAKRGNDLLERIFLV